MPFTRRWLLEDRVVLIQFDENVSLEDVTRLADEHESWLASSTTIHMIHYILDSRRIETYPRNILQIREHFHSSLTRTDWAIFVTEDYFVKHLGGLFARLFNYHFKAFASVRDAYRFLQDIEELPIPQDWSDNLDDTMPRR